MSVNPTGQKVNLRVGGQAVVALADYAPAEPSAGVYVGSWYVSFEDSTPGGRVWDDNPSVVCDHNGRRMGRLV